MHCQISLASLTDVPALLELEQASFDTDLISAAQYREFIKKNSSDVIVVKDHAEVIGSAIVLYRKNSRIARLYSIAVRTQFQGKSIAQNLLVWIENQALSRHCTELRLEVSVNNPRAIRFYERNAYEVFGEIENFYENGDKAFRMRKRLTQHVAEIN